MNDSIKQPHRRDSIQNDKIYDKLVHFNHFLDCKNIHQNMNQLLDDETIAEKEKRLVDLFPSIDKNTRHDVEETLLSIEKIGLFFSRIPYREREWLKKIISITENMPICVTISSANKETYGFPLVYVNKQFETTTGYNRNEIIGLNCKFLQPLAPISDEESQHKMIKNCLGAAIPISVIITNYKKGGASFHNLISLKPVIDDDGNYLYSIGIQTEITTEPLNKSDIHNVIDLMNILSKIT